MDNIIKEDNEIRENYEKTKDNKLRMKEKKQSYAKYVKEIHWPEISMRK